MIAGLRGFVAARLLDAVHVDVGGVIYRVNSSGSTLNELGDEIAEILLHTHLFVREDQLTLYGFLTQYELELFETLITVTGVGPRLACAILTKIQPNELSAAIAREDADILATVPGVGKRTAARLILELRGKLVPATVLPGAAGGPPPADAEVLAALRSLGYTLGEAHDALNRSGDTSGLAVEDRVIAALRVLSD